MGQKPDFLFYCSRSTQAFLEKLGFSVLPLSLGWHGCTPASILDSVRVALGRTKGSARLAKFWYFVLPPLPTKSSSGGQRVDQHSSCDHSRTPPIRVWPRSDECVKSNSLVLISSARMGGVAGIQSDAGVRTIGHPRWPQEANWRQMQVPRASDLWAHPRSSRALEGWPCSSSTNSIVAFEPQADQR